MKKTFYIFSITFISVLTLTYLGSFFISESVVADKQEKISSASLVSALENKEAGAVFLAGLEETKKDFIVQKKDFLEVNLEDMKIRFYEKGKKEKEVSILTKGDPQGWGGSAVGLYDIISGASPGYSSISEVFMPYALRYYGKYYIHGQPYYSWGEKLVSAISGGCLRLRDEDAEIVYNLVELGMPVLVIDKENDGYEYQNKISSFFPQLSAESYLVADLGSGRIFAEKNSKEQYPLASITKLMTALVVSENIDLRKSISIKEEMLQAYGDTEGLTVGKSFNVVELFYPLLIESSNDAAESLSYFLGRERTIGMMNEKAGAILMKQSKFTDPSGFDPGNITTAQDLFYLGRYILNNRPPILEITKGNRVLSFGTIDFNIENFWNKNIFASDPSFVGGKTGYTSEARQTALFIFRFEAPDNVQREIAIILLGARDIKTDAQKAYIWLQKNFF